jgi:hypothetical protein
VLFLRYLNLSFICTFSIILSPSEIFLNTLIPKPNQLLKIWSLHSASLCSCCIVKDNLFPSALISTGFSISFYFIAFR